MVEPVGAGGGGSGWGAEGLALLASAPPARDKGLRRRRRPRMTAHGRDIDDGQLFVRVPVHGTEAVCVNASEGATEQLEMKMSTGENLQAGLLSRTPPFGLRLWVVLGISIWAAILFVLGCICFFLIYWRKRGNRFGDTAEPEIPDITKEIAVDEARNRVAAENVQRQESYTLSLKERQTNKGSRKMLAHFLSCKSSGSHNLVGCSSMYQNDKAQCSYSSDEGTSGHNEREYSQYATMSTSPQIGLPEFSHLGWGYWFTLRDLEDATNGFSDDNIIGEGGYGVVYHGRLINGTDVAIKRLFNNIGQAEKEFKVEVESIGHVRHKNLVRLLGYCIEGSYRKLYIFLAVTATICPLAVTQPSMSQVNYNLRKKQNVQVWQLDMVYSKTSLGFSRCRMLVYEYINNGNLDQWLHGARSQHGVLTWEARMKIILDIAKALAYLHEGIEPKVIHRDIKSSNILIDKDFTGKLSDFGLSKLLRAGKSHITTRVMGTFGYVAPEYANTGQLNEKSDVYSFGVLLLEAVTGRDPVNYGRPTDEVHLLEWIKLMASSRRAEEVVDPAMEAKPTKRQLRRALVAALKCVDPKADKRPTMGSVVRMLEADDVALSSRQYNHFVAVGVDAERLNHLKFLYALLLKDSEEPDGAMRRRRRFRAA
ncbi:hypothetical protein OsJ_02495 [Oryza sativa Japonica Group]|uniref:non-specific serine/threonine protein kinase n=1 Tax=Oryza sativa subsp. japonica TaxID=39947 RepID=A2ZV42_ORYSJ|nr:hypothetical protein OsJ_02495 [Oryza sativa Japonica Group]